jgi:glucokinase
VTRIPVLEIGGSHLCTALVDTDGWHRIPGSIHRMPLDPHRGADEILDHFAECVRTLGALRSAPLAVAIPGPFDYARGIGRFRDVGKFDALNGVDVRAGLLARLHGGPSDVVFLNDAEAFGLGEWLAGTAQGYCRVVAITLGTGVGSAFVDAGRIVSDGARVPPDGHLYRTTIDGRPLEDVVSTRAIEAHWRRLSDNDADIRRVADLAHTGHPHADVAFRVAFRSLGEALRPWLVAFGAETLVVGGGLTASWDLIADHLRTGLGTGLAQLPVTNSRDADESAAIGAAWHAVRSSGVGSGHA